MVIFAERDDPKSVAVLWRAVRECVDGGREDLIATKGQLLFDVVKCFAFFVGGERGRIPNESDEGLSFNDPVDGLVVQGGSMVKET